ncbi:hypothetical protein [Paenarthrobacter sp. C1]|uniref:hypothetical protein n=1 Tax=Paenarthrobacter sp. C1 TaxID=3400220 RepID=UPI003BF5A385
MKLAPESSRERFRRVWPMVLGLGANVFVVAIALVYFFSALEVMMQSGGPAWVFWSISFLLGVVVLQWICISLMNGYRPASGLVDLSETGNLWHLTRNQELLEQAKTHRWVTISPERCRPLARMFNRAHPLALPRRAVYAFTTLPGRAHVRQNVSQRQMVGLLILDAAAVSGGVYTRSRDSAVALLEAYDGPAQVVE